MPQFVKINGTLLKVILAGQRESNEIKMKVRGFKNRWTTFPGPILQAEFRSDATIAVNSTATKLRPYRPESLKSSSLQLTFNAELNSTTTWQLLAAGLTKTGRSKTHRIKSKPHMVTRLRVVYVIWIESLRKQSDHFAKSIGKISKKKVI